MATQKVATWTLNHKLSSELALVAKYDVYADPSRSTVQPYLRLNGYEVRTLRNLRSWISSRAPFTIGIQVNGEGQTYSFNSGSGISQYNADVYDYDLDEQAGYYYVRFSSSTNIPVPGNATEFTLELTVTANGGESFSVTEHLASPISLTMNGPASIQAGRASIYTLSGSVTSVGNFEANAEYQYYFSAWGSTIRAVYGYSDPYTAMPDATEPFSQFGILPLSQGVTPGTVSIQTSGWGNTLVFTYKYDPKIGSFRDVYGVLYYMTDPLVLCTLTKTVTVTAQSTIDESLRPDFAGASHYTTTNFDQHLAYYGGAIQGEDSYGLTLTYRMKYGSYMANYTVRDNTGTTTVIKTGGQRYGGSYTYGNSTLNTAKTGATVEVILTDSLGFTSTYTDTFDILAYTRPVLTQAEARRCELTTETGGEVYPYQGQNYVLSEYGDYAIIFWGIDVSPIDNLNSRQLRIKRPSLIDPTGYVTETIPLNAYLTNGYIVVPADTEKSYDVVLTLTDDFRTVTAIAPLNTSLAILDFHNGGDGVAVGKVSETANMLDIHRNWTLRMPYNTYIQDYKEDGTAVNLYDWMQNTLDRIQAIIDARDDIIFWRGWYHGNSAMCIPAGYGTVYDRGPSNNVLELVPNVGRTACVVTTNPITITRPYLNVFLSVSESFGGPRWDNPTYRPTIYLLRTRPTTVNQSNGVPDGTIITYKYINGQLSDVGEINDGYCHWTIYYNHGIVNYFDVSSYMGQNLYVAVTCTQGGGSPSGYYTMRNGQISIGSIILSNTHD